MAAAWNRLSRMCCCVFYTRLYSTLPARRRLLGPRGYVPSAKYIAWDSDFPILLTSVRKRREHGASSIAPCRQCLILRVFGREIGAHRGILHSCRPHRCILDGAARIATSTALTTARYPVAVACAVSYSGEITLDGPVGPGVGIPTGLSPASYCRRENALPGGISRARGRTGGDKVDGYILMGCCWSGVNGRAESSRNADYRHDEASRPLCPLPSQSHSSHGTAPERPFERIRGFPRWRPSACTSNITPRLVMPPSCLSTSPRCSSAGGKFCGGGETQRQGRHGGPSHQRPAVLSTC